MKTLHLIFTPDVDDFYNEENFISLCGEGVRKLWDIPNHCTGFVLHVSKKKPEKTKYAHKFSHVSPNGLLIGLTFDGEVIPLYPSASIFLDDVEIKSTFWAELELL